MLGSESARRGLNSAGEWDVGGDRVQAASTGLDAGAGYFGGGGASTLRSPLCSGADTTPACSIASIRRAARL
jgi:hypothetical protein